MITESEIRHKLNAALSKKLNERKKELAENAVSCDCVADDGKDCGCGSTYRHDGVAEGAADEYFHQRQAEFHKKKLETAKPHMVDYHREQMVHHTAMAKKVANEGYEDNFGRLVYRSTPGGAYDESSANAYDRKMKLGDTKDENVDDGYKPQSQKAFESHVPADTKLHEVGSRVRINSKHYKTSLHGHTGTVVGHEIQKAWKTKHEKQHGVDAGHIVLHKVKLDKKVEGSKEHYAMGHSLDHHVNEDLGMQDPDDGLDHTTIVDEDTTASVGFTGLGGMDSTDGLLFNKDTKSKDTPKKKLWGLKQKLPKKN